MVNALMVRRWEHLTLAERKERLERSRAMLAAMLPTAVESPADSEPAWTVVSAEDREAWALMTRDEPTAHQLAMSGSARPGPQSAG